AGRGRFAVVAGGSGLYLRALLHGLVPLPPVDAELREALAREAGALGVPALHARLAAIDPEYAARIHATDRQRVLRALEVHAQTGRPFGAWHAAHRAERTAARYRVFGLGIDVPRAELHGRIEARVHDMVLRGWVDE